MQRITETFQRFVADDLVFRIIEIRVGEETLCEHPTPGFWLE